MKAIQILIFFYVITSTIFSQELLWQKELELDSLKFQATDYCPAIKTSDNSYLITTNSGLDSTIYLILYKIDKQGNEIWRKRFSYPVSLNFSTVVKPVVVSEIDNNNYLLVYIYQNTLINFGYKFINIDKKGNIINENNYSEENIEYSSSQRYYYNNKKFFIIRTIDKGQKLVVDRYDIKGDSINRIFIDSTVSIQKPFLLDEPTVLKNGNVIFCTQVWNVARVGDCFVYKLDHSGNVLMKQKLWNSKYFSCEWIELKDGSFLLKAFVFASLNDPIKKKIVFRKYTPDFKMVWELITGDNKFDDCNAISPTNDDGFVAGFSRYHWFNSGYHVNDYDLVKYDSSSNKLWNFRFGNDTTFFQINKIISDSDGNYLTVVDVEDTVDVWDKHYYNVFLYKIKDKLLNVKTLAKNNSTLSIYPNPVFYPSTFNLSFNLKNNSNIKIDLINSLGIIVGKSYTDYLIPCSHTIQYTPDANLSSGIYWLRMTINNKETIVKPVVIVR